METRFENIRSMILRYREKVNGISSEQPEESPFRVDPDLEHMGFYITDSDFTRIDEIRSLPGYNKLLVAFAVQPVEVGTERNESFSVVFLGADDSGNILQDHRADDPMGEETWPEKTSLVVSDSESSFESFLDG